MIGRRSRGLRAYIGAGRGANCSVQTMGRGDCLAVALCLYAISSYMAEQDEMDEADEVVDVALKLARRLGILRKFDDVVSRLEESLVQDGSLTPVAPADPASAPLPTFRGSDVRYRYNEDSEVDDIVPRGFLAKSAQALGAFRWLALSEDPERLPRLLSRIFLAGRTFGTLPEKIRAAIDDTSPVRFVSEAVGLTENESRVLLLLYRTSTTRELGGLMRRVPSGRRDEFCGKILGIEPSELNSIFRADQKLRAFGFIDGDGELSAEAAECIRTGCMDAFFSELLREEGTAGAYPLESYAVDAESARLATRLLRAGNASVLLYGEPGSGKTEFAKSVARTCSLRMLVFRNDAELNTRENALCRLSCLLSISKPDSLIVIDEADTILETTRVSLPALFGQRGSSTRKGTVNKIFEGCANRVVWIVNHTEQIEESTKRRFTYSVFFREMPEATIRKIAASRLGVAGSRLEGGALEEILALCGKFRVTGSSVDNVLRVIESAPDGADGAEVLRDVRNVLEANSALLHGRAKMRQTVTPAYDERVLNTSVPAEKLVSMVRNALAFAEREKSVRNGVRMLFYGASGTGKTEFARHLAETLGKRILLKRASDILGMFVGESERNVARAFEEAERGGQILLFDEADSFFASREGATRSWERTLVNEFLTQMEEFAGILVCTTNLRKILDPATNRRFHVCVEFRAMDGGGIRTLLGRYFPSLAFDGESVSRLAARSTVTPGDFGSLASRVRFMDAADITPALVVSELLKMQDDKDGGRGIGFGG